MQQCCINQDSRLECPCVSGIAYPSSFRPDRTRLPAWRGSEPCCSRARSIRPAKEMAVLCGELFYRRAASDILTASIAGSLGIRPHATRGFSGFARRYSWLFCLGEIRYLAPFTW